MLKVSPMAKFLLETSEVPTPKCVKNEIRDFEMTTAPYTSLNHLGMTIFINCIYGYKKNITV